MFSRLPFLLSKTNELKMKIYDMRLKSGTTITIAGPSQCGKSSLVEKIVELRNEIFSEEITKVFWYCSYLPTNKLDDVSYIVGLPNDIVDRIIPNCLVILDDFMHELSNSYILTGLMTKAVHHLPMTLIYITQNIFQKSNDTKTRRLNTNYLILFKNPQDKTQIDYLGRQMFPKDKGFLSFAYEDATKYPYSYLLIDSNQTTNDVVRVRTNIAKESEMTVYVPYSVNE